MVTATRTTTAELAHHLGAAAQAVRRSATADRLARIGFGARAFFYASLAVLTLHVAVLGGSGEQDNANGALRTVCRTVWGQVLVGIAAAGFVALGTVRLAAAVRDRDAGPPRRLLAAARGLVYWGIAAVPVSFLLGRRSTGSEQQQHQTAAGLLGMPAGRVVVALVGVVVLVVCGFQVRSAVTRDFARGMRIRRAGPWVRALVRWAGTVGITARAVVLLPIGVFFIVTAVDVDPNDAKGLDAEAFALSRHAWGTVLLVLAALGLLVFALYSLLELRYRDVDAS
jgi:hypothetical protein